MATVFVVPPESAVAAALDGFVALAHLQGHLHGGKIAASMTLATPLDIARYTDENPQVSEVQPSEDVTPQAKQKLERVRLVDGNPHLARRSFLTDS